MFYGAVVLFGVSLISGISCFPNRMSLDDSELGNLLQNFEDAREVNSRRTELSKLIELDINLLTERVLDKQYTENRIQKKNSENDEDSDNNQVLRELKSILDKHAEADLTDRSYSIEDEDQGDDETIHRSARKGWWCYWCNTKTKKKPGTNTKSTKVTRSPLG